MSLFNDNLDRTAAVVQVGYAGPPITGPMDPQPAREMNMKERVLDHHQRIATLENQNADLRSAIERLASMLVDQFGLVIK